MQNINQDELKDLEIETILFSRDGNNKVFRFSIEELRSEIHRCELSSNSSTFWGNDEEAGFYEWLANELKVALNTLVSLQPNIKHPNSYPNLVFESIKSEKEIIEIVNQYTQLKKSGKRYTGICPFHAEKHPSFTVYPETQSWYCFSCNKGGDVITFIMLVNNTDFKGALDILRGYQK
ncbi:CHC2 zinc finger domain-containing protein [Chloroflexota bacterium]